MMVLMDHVSVLYWFDGCTISIDGVNLNMLHNMLHILLHKKIKRIYRTVGYGKFIMEMADCLSAIFFFLRNFKSLY